ncbi:MAG: hypothetical protein ACOYMB_02680 [Patescibacteria group bacterium]
MLDINYFRDQYKNPHKYPRDNREMEEAFAMDNSHPVEGPDFEKKDARSEAGGILGKNYKKVVDLIFDYQEKNVSNEEQIIIKNRKTTVINSLKRVLLDIDAYVNQINVLKKGDNHYDSENLKAYQDEAGRSDADRRSLHNKLISDLKMTVRLINVFFNADFPEESRLAFEKQYADRAGYSEEEIRLANSKKKFLKFNTNGILIDFSKMPKDPSGERTYIAEWAFEVFDDLAVIQHEVEDLEKEKKD